MLESNPHLSQLRYGLGAAVDHVAGATRMLFKDFEPNWASALSTTLLIQFIGSAWLLFLLQQGQLDRVTRYFKWGARYVGIWWLFLIAYSYVAYEHTAEFWVNYPRAGILRSWLDYSVDHGANYDRGTNIMFAQEHVATSAMLLSSLGMVLGWRRPSVPRPLLVYVWLISLIAGSSILFRTIRGRWWEGNGDELSLGLQVTREERFIEDYMILERGMEMIVLVSLVVAALWAFGIVRRQPPPVPPELMRGAWILFAIGVIAFGATRGYAYDAEHPLPFSQRSEATCLDLGQLPSWNGDDESPAPPLIVTFLKDGKSVIDGTTLAEAEVGEVLGNKLSLYQQLAPEQPFTSMVGFAAPRSMKMAQLQGTLEQLRALDFRGIRALVSVGKKFTQTSTLGTLTRAPRCYSVVLPADLPKYLQDPELSWGHVVAELQSQPSQLQR